MIKTQIQIPEEQYRELREFAARREWSLAETFRRGAELLMEVYPPAPQRAKARWTPPASGSAGWKGLGPDALKDALHRDSDPILPARP
jgi:hypothetical protein